MDEPGPIIRRDGASPLVRLIVWVIVGSDVLVFGFLFYWFDELGFLQEAWGWPLLVAIVIAAIIQIAIVRRVLIRADKAGKLRPPGR